MKEKKLISILTFGFRDFAIASETMVDLDLACAVFSSFEIGSREEFSVAAAKNDARLDDDDECRGRGFFVDDADNDASSSSSSAR